MAHKMSTAMAFTLACSVAADMQLIQMSAQPHTSCRTVATGDPCYEKVMWAMQTGVAEHPEWYLPLSKDSSFEDFQQHLHGNAKLSDLCPKPCFAPEVAKLRTAAETQEEETYSTAATPAPTMEPGIPCVCNGTCPNFPYYDIDASGCLEQPEAERVDFLAGRFDELDADGDGCLNQSECDAPPEPPPVPMPTPCGCGEYVAEDTSVCGVCSGESRRRRENMVGTPLLRCTDCATGKFGVAYCDDCMEDDAMYLNASAEVGDTRIYVNKDTDLGGFVPTIGDSITIAKCCCESASDHGTFEITSAAPNTPAISYNISALTMDFSQFDRVTRTCSSTDGVGYPSFFPCGCGSEVCGESTKCDITGAGECGTCIPTITPTPAPTVSAKGDPHLVNLNGEHFDVNHGGEFTLLRIPQNTIKPAEVELKASILPEHGKPCTTYITEVELSGRWFGGKVVQVRSYLRSHAKNETDKFLGLRVLDRTPGAPSDEAPWEKLSRWADTSYVVSEPQAKDGFGVTMSTAKWHSNKDAGKDVPIVAGQVEIQVKNKLLSSEPTKFVIRQDLPRQEHLNLAVRRLSSLGRADVGGLLGFDTHPESLEDVTPECQRHRDGLDRETGPRHNKPGWKARWEKIKEARMQPHDAMNDNEAAANLADRDMMCVCPDDTSTEGLGENVYVEGLVGGDNMGGVLVEFQTGRLAEATWD